MIQSHRLAGPHYPIYGAVEIVTSSYSPIYHVTDMLRWLHGLLPHVKERFQNLLVCLTALMSLDGKVVTYAIGSLLNIEDMKLCCDFVYICLLQMYV